MIRPRQKLRSQVVGTPDKPLALHLANHIVCHFRCYLSQTVLNLLSSFQSSPQPSLIVSKKPLLVLYLYPVGRQLLNLGLQQRDFHHFRFHVLREAAVIDGLTDNIIIRPPSSSRDMKADFSKKVEG